MKGSARIKERYLAASLLLIVSLACNLSNPRGPADSPPEVVTVVATATLSDSAEAPAEENNAEAAPVEQTPETTSSSSESSPSGEGDTRTTPEGDIFTSVSVKDGKASFEGNIVYPGKDADDSIYVKPIGFDSTKTEGSLVFSLTCSGRGKAKVNYKGGAVRSGSPGCGETWTAYVINGSPDSQITLHLDASGNVDWSLTVTSGE